MGVISTCGSGSAGRNSLSDSVASTQSIRSPCDIAQPSTSPRAEADSSRSACHTARPAGSWRQRSASGAASRCSRSASSQPDNGRLLACANPPSRVFCVAHQASAVRSSAWVLSSAGALTPTRRQRCSSQSSAIAPAASGPGNCSDFSQSSQVSALACGWRARNSAISRAPARVVDRLQPDSSAMRRPSRSSSARMRRTPARSSAISATGLRPALSASATALAAANASASASAATQSVGAAAGALKKGSTPGGSA